MGSAATGVGGRSVRLFLARVVSHGGAIPAGRGAEPFARDRTWASTAAVTDTAQSGRVPEAAQGLWMVLSANQPAAVEHAERMIGLAGGLADHLALEDEERGELLTAARFHDIGECFLPAGLAERAVAFSESEREAMRSHAELGAEALSEAGMNVQVVDAVRAHHERWDGGGYPAGASGRADPAGGAHPTRLRAWDGHAQAPGVGRTDHRR